MKKYVTSTIVVLVILVVTWTTFGQDEEGATERRQPGKDKIVSPSQDRQIQNLRAFAKLYGYVKYFHPSDEASAIDWDKFAIYGVKQIKDAKDTNELKAALQELFLPIAPTIQIYTSDQKLQDTMKHLPEDTTGLKIVAWQHEGVGLLGGPEPYKSIRLNRENRIRSGGYASGVVGQSIDAAEYRGKEIMLKVFARIKVSG
jgi:hypothetical protein